MSKLLDAREKIDEIDEKIISLYEERMTVVLDVIKYKIENNIPILDNSREVLMLEKNLAKIKDEKFKKYYSSVLEGYLKASKEMQKDILETSKK
jgi:chorismate mutase/prephenate dehydratase